MKGLLLSGHISTAENARLQLSVCMLRRLAGQLMLSTAGELLQVRHAPNFQLHARTLNNTAENCRYSSSTLSVLLDKFDL